MAKHISADLYCDAEGNEYVRAVMIDWQEAIVALELASSRSAALRLIKSGALRIEGEKVTDRYWPVVSSEPHIQIGRKAVRMILAENGITFTPTCPTSGTSD